MRHDVEAFSKFADDIRRSGGGEVDNVSQGETVLSENVAGRVGNSQEKVELSNMVPTMTAVHVERGAVRR